MLNTDELEHLLNKLKNWRRFSMSATQPEKDQFNIILREKIPFPQRNYLRRIIVSISGKTNQYSITSYEIHSNGHSEDKYKQIYTMNVVGNIEIKSITKDLKDMINGKDEKIFYPNYPHRIKS